MIDWTSPEVLALLGSNTDEAIAAELGVSRSAVRRHRVLAGTPAYRSNIDHDGLREALGTAPDSELAERFGCSIFTVFNARARYGVRSWRDQQRGAV